MRTSTTGAQTSSTQLVVRVDHDLRQALEAQAQANERTVAQQVRYLLKQHVNDD